MLKCLHFRIYPDKSTQIRRTFCLNNHLNNFSNCQPHIKHAENCKPQCLCRLRDCNRQNDSKKKRPPRVMQGGYRQNTVYAAAVGGPALCCASRSAEHSALNGAVPGAFERGQSCALQAAGGDVCIIIKAAYTVV